MIKDHSNTKGINCNCEKFLSRRIIDSIGSRTSVTHRLEEIADQYKIDIRILGMQDGSIIFVSNNRSTNSFIYQQLIAPSPKTISKHTLKVIGYD